MQEFKESSTTFLDAGNAEHDPQLPDRPEAAPAESSHSFRALENKFFPNDNKIKKWLPAILVSNQICFSMWNKSQEEIFLAPFKNPLSEFPLPTKNCIP